MKTPLQQQNASKNKLLLLTLTIVLLLTTSFLQAETWDMPTPYPDATFHTVNIATFAKDVNRATRGELQIKYIVPALYSNIQKLNWQCVVGKFPLVNFFLDY